MSVERKMMTKDNPAVLWVGVEVLGLLTQSVHFFATEKAAKQWFKDCTGFDYDGVYNEQGNEDFNVSEYDQTKIFEISRHEVLALVKALIDARATQGSLVRLALKIDPDGGMKEYERLFNP